MEDALNETSMIAAEAVYEICPCERLERWIEALDLISLSYRCRTENPKTANSKAYSDLEFDF